MFVLFPKQKKHRCQIPILARISSFCQFQHPTPRRDAMKGNNNNSESWQFTTCWLEISDSAVSAEIKTLCLHVEFKTRFELWSWCYTNPCTVPENSLLNFCTLYRSGWASTRCLCTVLVNTSCYRCSNRCGFLLQTQCVFKRKRLLFIAFKDLSARSSTRFPQKRKNNTRQWYVFTHRRGLLLWPGHRRSLLEQRQRHVVATHTL